MLKSKRFNTAATIILTVLVIITLLPLALIVISSFTKESALIRKPCWKAPRKAAFATVFKTA